MRSKGRGGGLFRTRRRVPELLPRVHKTSPAPVLFVLATILSTVTGCGIQSYPYLAPVDEVRAPLAGEKFFEFTNRTDNDATFFYGYEIYYKFYSTDVGSSFESEEQTLQNGVSLSQATGTLGFHRLSVLNDSVSKPLVSVEPGNRGTSFQITLDFSGVATPGNYPEFTYNTKNFEAARFVLGPGDTADNFYSFSPGELTDEYEDLTTEMLTGTGTVRLALIVFTYGKYNIYQELYSAEAAYLGSITLTTP